MHTSRAGEALSSPDHAHNLEALDGPRGCLHRLKPRVGLMTCFNAPWSASMMFFRYFKVRCLVSFEGSIALTFLATSNLVQVFQALHFAED